MVRETLEHQIEQAVALLKTGGVVVFPTETAYGLAVDATNAQAVERVFAMKGREGDKSFPLIASSREMVETVAGIPRGLDRLAGTFWPGPLTLVLPVMGDHLASGVVRNGTIAIRVSSHSTAQALSAGLGAPIVSTSANKSGQPACYSLEEVQEQFAGGDKPDVFIDGGTLIPEPASTIVGVDDYGYPEVLRQGSIEIDI